MGDLWIFGYGSLMWNPGFDAAEVRPATLSGYRRCFCIQSVHHRGTHDRPGLVLGLDRGGTCQGLAFRVFGQNAPATLAALRAREQVNGVYRETRVSISTPHHNEPISALAYIAERAHPSYAGRLPLHVQARIIRAARGLSGTNLDYLASTLAHMALLAIRDRELEHVSTLAGAMLSRGTADARRRRISGLVTVSQTESVLVERLRRTSQKRFGFRIKIAGARLGQA